MVHCDVTSLWKKDWWRVRLPLAVVASHDHKAVKSGGVFSTRVAGNRAPCKARAAYE